MVCHLIGHLDNSENRNLVYKDNPSNMGLFLGTVDKFNKSKGYITLKLKEPINIGDTVSVEGETGTYNVSELMINSKNVKETKTGQIVTIGRMKGKILPGAKVYKMSSKELSTRAKESYRKENKKIPLNCEITIQKFKPISIDITSNYGVEPYKNLCINTTLDYIPEDAKNQPLQKSKIINQISKTASTPYEFKNIKVNLDDNVFLPSLSILNELRRTALDNVSNYIESKIHRSLPDDFINNHKTDQDSILNKMRTYKTDVPSDYKICVLLNILNLDFDYSCLENVDNVYVPLKYFTNRKYENILKTISEKFDTYVYMPTIIKGNYKNLFYANIQLAVEKYNIHGFVISNICNIKLLNDLFEDLEQDFKIIANYTFNVFNSHTVLELKKLGVSDFTLSPELDKTTLDSLNNFGFLQKELIVYGKAPILNMNYCLLGQTNKCYPTCGSRCTTSNHYFLKDRLNMKFPILPDNIQTVTTVFNSKTTSLDPTKFNIDYARIDILYEDINEINNIISTVKSGHRFEGKEFTNGNLNRQI